MKKLKSFVKIQYMLKERKVWIVIRNLEKKLKYEWIEEKTILSELYKKFSQEEAKRMLESMDGTYLESSWKNIIEPGHAATYKAYKTKAQYDSYFEWKYYWPKLADGFGMGKIYAIVLALGTLIGSFFPGTWPNILLKAIANYILSLFLK